jgi:hypothetical protein
MKDNRARLPLRWKIIHDEGGDFYMIHDGGRHVADIGFGPGSEEDVKMILDAVNGRQELLEVMSDLHDFLLEEHHDEIENNHYGDATEPPAPGDTHLSDPKCSYCNALRRSKKLLDQ